MLLTAPAAMATLRLSDPADRTARPVGPAALVAEFLNQRLDFMNKIPFKTLLVAGLVAVPLFVAGCSFVALEEGADDVEILQADQVEACERVGRTRVSTADRIGFIPRGEPAIKKDLDRLARNSAVDLGGDTAVRQSDIEDGKATYEVFQCR